VASGEAPGAALLPDGAAAGPDTPAGSSVIWLLLPPPGVEVCSDPLLPPVTLQQLQLAGSGLACANAMGAPTAALLLALLLQRADPGLRAEFLGGPGGSALLVACQYWGCYHVGLKDSALAQQHGRFLWAMLAPCTVNSCTDALTMLLQGTSAQVVFGKRRAMASAPSVALLLAWCYLQPVAGWEAQLPHSSRDSSCEAWGVVSTSYHYRSQGDGGQGKDLSGGGMEGAWRARGACSTVALRASVHCFHVALCCWHMSCWVVSARQTFAHMKHTCITLATHHTTCMITCCTHCTPPPPSLRHHSALVLRSESAWQSVTFSWLV
jgi:hypothetical protein